jgi:hypothetical protein
MFDWGELEFHAASLVPHALRDIPDVLNLLDEIKDKFPAIIGLLQGGKREAIRASEKSKCVMHSINVETLDIIKESCSLSSFSGEYLRMLLAIKSRWLRPGLMHIDVSNRMMRLWRFS